MKKTLLFGCGGFVGKYLAKELYEHDCYVIGTDVVSANNELLKYIKEYQQFDMLDYSAVESIIEKSRPDYIVNLAAVSSVAVSWKIPQQTIDNNVNGPLNILEAVKKFKLDPKILLIGSSEEYEISDTKIAEDYPLNANNPYGIAKETQEHIAQLYRGKYGMKIINTRTFNHTGVGQADIFAIPSFVKQVADIHKSHKNGAISVGNLDVKRDIGDVRDMVRAYRMILESNTAKPVFNIGSGDCYKLADILEYIVGLTKQNIEIITDPDKLRPIDNAIIWCDNSLIKSEIGWQPKYTVYDAIEAMFVEMT